MPLPRTDMEDGMSEPHWKRAVVEEKIAAHKLDLLAAENEVQRLRGIGYELDELLNSTSPIMSSLSLDVLTHIFDVACNEEDVSLPVQFLIGAVCREWRRIAWSTPHLWRKISIYLSKEKFETQESLFQQWIGRTAASPLHIQLDHLYGQWEPPVTFFTQLLKTCNRWISFQYHQSSLNFQSALSLEANCEFPILNSFEVFGIPKAPGNLNQWQLNSPPQLRSLYVLAQRNFYLGIDWALLEAVSVIFNFRECINLLGLSCSPKSLVITILPTRPRTAIPTVAPYRLQHLTSLTIEGETASVASLLGFITIPAVKELSVDFKKDESDHHWIQDFTELVRRSAFQLTKLTLQQSSITDERAIFDIFRNMPSIKDLDLDCAPPFTLSDQSINQLNFAIPCTDNNRRRFLPNLGVFAYKGEISFTLDALLGMMKGRSEELQELCIDIMYPNELWYRNKNPNAIHNFYTDVASLQGVVLTLEWDSITHEVNDEQMYLPIFFPE